MPTGTLAESLKKVLASALTAAVVLGTCPPRAAAQSAATAGRAASATAPAAAAAAFQPVPAAWQPAFQGLSSWLTSPVGRKLLQEVRPDLASLSWASSKGSAVPAVAQLAGPLAAGKSEEEQAELNAAVEGIAFLNKVEQRALMGRIGAAADQTPAVRELKAAARERKVASARGIAAALRQDKDPGTLLRAAEDVSAAPAPAAAQADLPAAWRLSPALKADVAPAARGASAVRKAPHAPARSSRRIIGLPLLVAVAGIVTAAVAAGALAGWLGTAGILLAALPVVGIPGAAKPVPATELLTQLSAKYVTGSVIDPAVESNPATEAALKELEEQGVLLGLADGRKLFLDFATRTSETAQLKVANRLGQAAAAKLAQPGSEDLAIGLIDDAVARLTVGPESEAALAAYSGLKIVAANAAARLWASAQADGPGSAT